jgi:hypothetical protein
MRQLKKVLLASVAIASTAVSHSTLSFATSKGINTEAVNNFIDCYGDHSNDLTNSIVDANGFAQTLVHGSEGYYWRQNYNDASVWTTDFYDPQRTGYSPDSDGTYFDGAGTAFAYFVGHGVVSSGNTDYHDSRDQWCFNGTNCAAPVTDQQGAATTFPSFCLVYPGTAWNGTGTCSYTDMARTLSIGNCTQGNGPYPGRAGHISYSTGQIAWGESAISGGWASAGTNGGANVVVLHASFAELSNRHQEVANAFAGIHMLATTFVHTGDTANIADRGTNFAWYATVNPLARVSDGWTYGLYSNADDNNYCANYDGSTPYGGGRGVNGCGGQMITARGATQTEANNHLAETWTTVQNDNDALGRYYWSAAWSCNWDCNAYPFAR